MPASVIGSASGFNPTLVRFEPCALQRQLRSALVSIPHWSDLSRLPQARVAADAARFNPTLVRFEPAAVSAAQPALRRFQSHIGPI